MQWHDPIVIIPSFIAIMFAMLKWFSYRFITTIDSKLEAIPEIDRRLIAVETSLQHRPQCSQHAEHMMNIKALHSRLDGIASKVDKLTGSLEGLNRAVDLMNQFLIEQGGR